MKFQTLSTNRSHAPRAGAAALAFALAAVWSLGDTAAQSSRSLPGPPPHAPPGFAAVLKPSPYGGYWVLMPSQAAAPGADHARSAPEPAGGDCWGPECALPLASDEPATAPSLEREDPRYAIGAELDEWSLARAVLDGINQRRAEASLPPLQPHPLLTEAARGHSVEMGELGYFDHQSPTPGRERFTDRLALAGLTESGKSGENIQKAPLTLAEQPPDQAAEAFVESWMQSPGHRDNIMDEAFMFTGVGIAITPRGIYATQVFSGRVGASEAADAGSDEH